MAQINIGKVFISYSHDSREHRERVLALADRLCREGIDCQLDWYETSPPEGWPIWMLQQIEESAFVIVVCTELYQNRFMGKAEGGTGLGVNWEGAIITHAIYMDASRNKKFIPVVFSDDDAAFRPLVMRTATYYNLSTNEGYEDLYGRLTGQHATPKPQLGQIRKLSARQRIVDEPTPATSIPATSITTAAPPRANVPLVLMMRKAERQQPRYEIIPAERIESGTAVILHLTPANTRQAAFLTDLRDGWDKTVAVASGLDAFVANVEKATQLREAGKDVWLIHLVPEKNANTSSLMEMSINGYSPDDLAELRARRILLNEQPRRDPLSTVGRLNFEMIEHSIAGTNDFIGSLRSPFPDLYAQYHHDEAQFIEVAQLFAVLFLRLSHTVKHVFKLDIKLQPQAKLSVKFEGERPQRYANQEPRIIKIKGTCALSKDNDDDEE